MVDNVQFYFTRVDFNGKLGIRRKAEMLTQHTGQTADLCFIEIGRRTAAPVHLMHFASGKQRGTGGDFFLQHGQVFIRLMLLTGD